MAIKLTIDGRNVAVEPGTTLLAAARRAGADIPTLCHMDGIEPWPSCFLCVVQVEGKPNLTPACAARAEDGMVVTTDSEDIRAARRTALELLLSDHRGDCVAPCSMACPAGLDIQGFIRRILDGDDRGAIALIKERIPLPAALGRICPRYCENVCRRRESEEAIAICALKRYAADADLASGDPYVPDRAAPTGRKVAVVGAGPAGLSAAFYLLRRGHECVLFDRNRHAGGMLRYGVPEFDMPADVLDAEVEVIRRLGGEFRMSHAVATGADLDALRADYDAVLLAFGAQADGPVQYEGAELCLPALELLRDAAAGGGPGLGGAVVVIGGGNEAVAAARTAVRLGARHVTLLWEKQRRRMPCSEERVVAAIEEGVRLEANAPVVRVAGGDRERLTVTCVRGGGELTLDASCVVAAPQRRVDAEAAKALGLQLGRRGLAADARTHTTDADGVFAAGEAVTGPGSAVRAVAAGRSAAACIDPYLRGGEAVGEPRTFNVSMGRLSDADRAVLLRGVPERARAPQRRLGAAERRSGFDEAVQGLSPEDALREAARCLQCDCLARDDCKLRRHAAEYGANVRRFRGEPRPYERDDSSDEVVFEPAKCILCGLCVRIAAKRGERLGMGFSRRGFVTRVAVPFEAPLREGLAATLRECAEACPTAALALRRRAPALTRNSTEELHAGTAEAPAAGEN